MTTRQTRKSRNPAEFPVLGMLASGPAHGYDICRRLQTELGAVWNLGRSQIYALLSRLERDGLVVHERIGQESLPAKNIFTLTSEGHEVFVEWAKTPVQHVRNMRLEFLTKLWFADELKSESEGDLIERQLEVCREKARKLVALKPSCATQIETRSIDFRLTMIEAATSWLEGLSKTTEGGLKRRES
ncbi:MAG: PadR family transcriptional regulator [Desulfomonile tiedjei]|nr:PadR family transcriptional regulator [Desulfomonile tiedjei]